MSLNPDNLPTSQEAAERYIRGVLKNPLVDDVYVKGSRSPKNLNEPRVDSDWDLEIITNTKTALAHPRKWGWLHADIHLVTRPSVESVQWEQVIKNQITIMPIDHQDFNGMSASKAAQLAEAGIVSVNQLSAMTPEQIDGLPVKGIGEKRSVQWHEKSIELLGA